MKKAKRKGLGPSVNNEKSDLPENCVFLLKRKVFQNGSLVRTEKVKSKYEPLRTLSKVLKTQPQPGCRLALVHFPSRPCPS